MFLKASNAPEAFEKAFDLILSDGEPNENTQRVTGVLFEIVNPLDYASERWPKWRNWSQRYVELEWQWYEAATRDPSMVEKVAKIWTGMKDENGEVNSNYGWQVQRAEQWSRCAHGLAESILSGAGTRKHVLTIYDGKEKLSYKYDTPCTVSFTFVLKRESTTKFRLDLHTHMRSNDVWFGLCNDLPAFALFQVKMVQSIQDKLIDLHNGQASNFRISVGRHMHFVDDLHLYNNFMNKKNENI